MHSSLRYFATVITLLLLAPLAQAEEIAVFPERMVVTVVDEAGKPITHARGGHRFSTTLSTISFACSISSEKAGDVAAIMSF